MSSRKSQAKTFYFPDRQDSAPPPQQHAPAPKPSQAPKRSASTSQHSSLSHPSYAQSYSTPKRNASFSFTNRAPSPPLTRQQAASEARSLSRKPSYTTISRIQRSESSSDHATPYTNERQVAQKDDANEKLIAAGAAAFKQVAGPASTIIGLGAVAATAAFAPAMLPGVAAATLGPFGATAAAAAKSIFGDKSENTREGTSAAPPPGGQSVIGAMIAAGFAAWTSNNTPQKPAEPVYEEPAGARFTELPADGRSDNTGTMARTRRISNAGYGQRSR